MVHSLNQLGKLLGWSLVHHPTTFDALDSAIRKYKGTDWKRRVKSNTCTYTEIDAYYSGDLKISVATWLPDQYAMLNKGPETKCWVAILQGTISTFVADEAEAPSVSLVSTGDIVRVDKEQQVFRNDSDEIVVSLQVYYPYRMSRFA
jgi:hypothetical protein